jgi:hypothetical protein
LRRSEETALEFQEKLRQVHDITLKLAQQTTLVDIYRLAVVLGRSELGFDRLGLWVLNAGRNMIMGTFGTDEHGQLRDEQAFAYPIEAIYLKCWLSSNVMSALSASWWFHQINLALMLTVGLELPT